MNRRIHSALTATVLTAAMSTPSLAQCVGGSCAPRGPSTRAFFPDSASRVFDPSRPPQLALPEGVPVGVAEHELTPEQTKLLAEHNKRRVEGERKLRVLWRNHFDNTKNAKIRAEGLAKLREFDDPALYPLLMTVFDRKDHEVRGAVLDLLAERRSYEADATLAWGAMFDKDEWFRDEAQKRLLSRVKTEGGKVPGAVSSVIASAFLTSDPHTHTRAGQLSQTLGLIEAIPAMISAQAGTSASPSRSSSDGNLATIVIGRQVTFISDLTPVVGENAVGFDPQVSTLTEGVYINVNDAVVTWRNVALNSQLKAWASALTGKNVAHLDFDHNAWRRWYFDDLKPQMTRRSQLVAAMVGEPESELAPSRTPANAQ